MCVCGGGGRSGAWDEFLHSDTCCTSSTRRWEEVGEWDVIHGRESLSVLVLLQTW